jgi:type IV pilus secretin PilQ/predicted competence protein
MAFYRVKRCLQALACVFVLAGLCGTAANAETGNSIKAGVPFSMEFRDADIKDVLRAVGQAANLNLIVSDTVTGKVSMSLKDVDMWDALDSILKTKGLTYVREGNNIVRVVAVSEARDEDLETRVFHLGYASGKEALSVIEKIKSDKAKVSSDARTNSIIVKDLSLNIDRMERVLKNLDTRIPQVLIEAKIVEVSSNYARELGVQWGGQYTGGNTTVTGGATGVQNSTSGSSSSTSVPPIGNTTFYPQLGDVGRSGNAYVVNLPAAVGAGSGGALGFSFGRLMGGKLSLDLQLSAMQTTGNGKILSNPKVLTLDNKEAKISSGTDIPIQTISSTATGVAGTTTTGGVQTISANLSLSAIPTITNDNRIVMVIKVEKAEPGDLHSDDYKAIRRRPTGREQRRDRGARRHPYQERRRIRVRHTAAVEDPAHRLALQEKEQVREPVGTHDFHYPDHRQRVNRGKAFSYGRTKEGCFSLFLLPAISVDTPLSR